MANAPFDGASLVHLTPLDPGYPSRLRRVAFGPASVTVSGGSVEAATTVAVVGSRAATDDARRFARDLAGRLARAGVVVVSGGAIGVDEAAHRGALDENGRTWAVAGTGHDRCFPPENKALFDAIARGPGAMIWPFAAKYAHRSAFLVRNRVLVALADAVVVVQAGRPSGALNAASWARRLSKPLWVVPAPPWAAAFAGSLDLLDGGARPLTSADVLLESLEGPSLRGRVGENRAPLAASRKGPDGLPSPPATLVLSAQESAVLHAISSQPRHTDAIGGLAGLPPQATAAALLTLALENVLVEGPPGFFRRRDGYNR